jgi:hypothetical protein
VGLARLAILCYIVVAAFGSVDAETCVPQGGPRLLAANAPAHEQLQSADDDANDDDDDVVDADFDDDCLPSTTSALLVALPPCARLTIAAERAPASASRDPLFRPPRLASA